MSDELPYPSEPVKVAIIGCGNRTSKIYHPLIGSLARWIDVVAVCDPVKEHADKLAGELGVPAFYNIRELVRNPPMEAALVITPIPSHHSISVYLSSHGIHNMTETSWCNLLAQAKDMVATAQRKQVVVRVAENFFRFPIDRFAQLVKKSGYLGRVGRIFSYNDHTGFHNNSRWIRFAEAHPLWVQAFSHTMPTGHFHSQPQRFHTEETFRSHTFGFPGELLVIDQSANIKGFLGRQTRPGYNEWHGEAGTLMHRGASSAPGVVTTHGGGQEPSVQRVTLRSESELRLCSFGANAGYADNVSPVINEYSGTNWTRTYAETVNGTLEYRNMLRSERPSEHRLYEYGACVMGHITDFANVIRGVGSGEFDESDALMSLMMNVGANESALRGGQRLALPLNEDLLVEERARQSLKVQFKVDPLDVEGMLSLTYPKP